MQFQKRMKLFVGISALAFLVILFLLPDLQDMGDFYNNCWGPGYLLLHHQSPYNIKQLFEFTNALWMPQFVGAFYWLGAFTKTIAARVWVFINFCSLLYIFFYFVEKKPSPIILGLIIFVLCLFPPLSTYMLFGQCGLICIAALLISTKSKPFFTPLFLLIGLGKPQLGFIFVIGFCIHILIHRKQDILALLSGTVFWIVILLAPFWLFFPKWIPDFLNNIQTNAAWDQPVLHNVINKTLGFSGLYSWIPLLIIGLGISIYSWVKFENKSAIIITFTTTSLASIYLWSWDFVLLFPLIIYMFTQLRLNKAFIYTALLTTINSYFWYIRLSSPISDYENWPLPILYTLATLIFWLIIFKSNKFTNREQESPV